MSNNNIESAQKGQCKCSCNCQVSCQCQDNTSCCGEEFLFFEQLPETVINNNNCFYQSDLDFLQGLINADFSLKAIIIENGWLELDSMNDYEIYQKMYHNNSLKELIVNL